MRLKKNWKDILLYSYSMWAIYIGLAILVIPEVFYLAYGYQLVSPYWVGYGGVGLMFLGGLGRVIDQGIDKDA